MFDLTVMENGNLELTLDYAGEVEKAELIAEIRLGQEKKTDLDILIEGTERYWTNGSYQPFDAGAANPFVGLTDAPMVSESMICDDNGNMSVQGEFWYHDNYMIESFLDILIETGRFEFKLAK